MESSTRRKGTVITVAVLAAIACLVALRWLPSKQYLGTLAEEIESLGVWGPLLLAAIYVLATLLLLPAWVLTVLAGFLFGVVEGTLTASLASLAAASSTFLLGRTVARDWVRHKLAGSPRFQAIDAAVDRQGFKIVALIRLSPVFPFAFSNYALSLTRIRFRDFFLASWIGMLPLTVFYVYLGSTAQSIVDITTGNSHHSLGQKLLLAVGLAATIALVVVLTRLARSAMRNATETPTSADR
jgi:uncharacterized membrane protein YdjX (TVP38/TMEM64 family)